MKKIHLALIVVTALILIGSLIYGGLHLYSHNNTLPKGTTLAGWEVGGLNITEVRSELEEKLHALESVPLVLQVEGNSELTLKLKQAGMTYAAAAFEQGLQDLTEGRLWDRVKARYSFPQNWSLEAHLNIAQLKTILSPAWERESFGDPVDATRRITGDDRVVYTPEKTSLEVDWTGMITSLSAAAPTRFNRLITLQEKGITLEVPLTILQPDITLNALKEQGIERKIMQFSTSLGASGPGRIYNVESAAKAVNGTVLPPGAVFDYGKAIEKAKIEYGFREAPVIVNGKLQAGVGGGICQVSSTLYNAALRTGLEIVERRNHSLPVNYLPKGQDATFAEGYINFRFRNTTGKYLVIKAAVQGRSLTIKLFGTFPQNVTYKVHSQIVEVLPPVDKYVNDPSLPRGGTRVIQNGKTGYVVETYSTRLVDGKSTEVKKLSRDVYYAQKRLIAINRGGVSKSVIPEAPRKQLVEDGVRSE
ncbi:VanW family protein [Paenibacillus sp. FSL E2-0201]|uniref:VanW family protein n=1 Tax=Paenibacillus sp. FSL E2-0201 TaxID=2954726 RepID=UPI0030DD5049